MDFNNQIRFFLTIGFLVFSFNLKFSSAQSIGHCPPLKYTKGVSCSNVTGEAVNCTGELPIGSRIQCLKYYKPNNGVKETVCTSNGTWSSPGFFCEIDCGKTTSVSVRPYHATIYRILRKGFNARICSGALISERHILTSASCILNRKNELLETDELIVELGTKSHQQAYNVKGISYSSEKTSKAVEENDLAILTIEEVEFSDTVLPICVPHCSQLDSIALSNGSRGEIIQFNETIQDFAVEIVPECEEMDLFCAKGDELSIEETGAALSFHLKSTYLINGILSHPPEFNGLEKDNNFKCANNGDSKYFKRVYSYMDWIDSIIQETETYEADTDNEKLQFSTAIEPTTIYKTTPSPMKPWIICNRILEPLNDFPPNSTLEIRNAQVDSKRLLDHLKAHSDTIWKLNFTNICFTEGFPQKINLPQITEIEMNNVGFIAKPKNFVDYFPFYRNQLWNLNNITDSSVDFLLNEGNLFILKVRQQRFLVYDWQIANDVLYGTIKSGFHWRDLTFANIRLRVDYVPTTLDGLFLTNVSLVHGNLEDLIGKNHGLQRLGVIYPEITKIDLKIFRLSKIEMLKLENVHLLYNANKFIFSNLTHLYLGKNVTFDEDIIKNLDKLFPKLRNIAIQKLQEETLLNQILELPSFDIILLQKTSTDTGTEDTEGNNCPFNYAIKKQKGSMATVHKTLDTPKCDEFKIKFFGNLETMVKET